MSADGADKSDARSGGPASVRLAVAALSSLALLQAVVVLASGGGIVTKAVAVGLAIAGIWVRLPTLCVLASLILVNFGAHLAASTPPFPYRIAHVAILVTYGAVALAGIAATFTRVRFASALGVTWGLAVAFVAAEAVIERVAPPEVLGVVQVKWIGGAQPDPVLGEMYPPYAVLRTVYPDNPRGYFDETRPSPKEPSSATEYSVTYSLNALGCRGRDYPIPRPQDRKRILVLGGSSALGVGVREPDTFAARLESAINALPQQSAGRVYDVINCGANGYGTREQRLLYELIAFRYGADVVLLSMTDHDNLSRRDELRLGYVHQIAKYERLLLSVRLFQYARHEGRRPFDYSGTLEELSKLDASCRARGARLAVVLFGSSRISPHWNDFAKIVSAKLQGTSINVLDLGLVLAKDDQARVLTVHPLDANPNEIAHRSAAEEIERFLRRQRSIG
jgi:hypothetical protein